MSKSPCHRCASEREKEREATARRRKNGVLGHCWEVVIVVNSAPLTIHTETRANSSFGAYSYIVGHIMNVHLPHGRQTCAAEGSGRGGSVLLPLACL